MGSRFLVMISLAYAGLAAIVASDHRHGLGSGRDQSVEECVRYPEFMGQPVPCRLFAASPPCDGARESMNPTITEDSKIRPRKQSLVGQKVKTLVNVLLWVTIRQFNSASCVSRGRVFTQQTLTKER